ncbi:MAG: ABC transporter ATP-binding protein [Bacteroidota bacterium]
MRELSHLNKYLAKYKYYYVFGAIFIVGIHILSIIPARLTRHIINLIKDSTALYQFSPGPSTLGDLPGSLMQQLLLYSGLLLLLAFVKALCSYWLRQTIFVVANQIEYELKNELYSHYQTLPLAFYRRNSTGDLMTRLSEDVRRVKMYLGPAMMLGLNALTLFLVLVPYMFAINVKLTLCSMLPVSFLVVGIYYVSSVLHQLAEETQSKLSALTTFVQETFSGISVLLASAREIAFRKNFVRACEEYKTKTLRLATINALLLPLATGVTGLGVILTVLVGGKGVMEGTITMGSIAEFIMYMNLITWPIISVSLVLKWVQRAAASQKRINEFLQEKTRITSPKQLVRAIEGSITFRDVSFAYPDSGVRALQSLSFTVPAGTSLAIVGPTGSGKSTVVNLLTRLYDADTGLITIDGVPIQDYAIPALRQQIGCVPQNVFLFPDTIRKNIAFGKEGATEAQIIQAVQNVDLYTSIQQFPNQMDTMLGEGGSKLSGGQKQRIAIARALVREPRILILDDSFSAVDAKTERNILVTLKKAMQGRTTLIISHRISVSRLANQILVLDAARVAEQGSHEDLLEAKGLYYKLYKHQYGQPARQDEPLNSGGMPKAFAAVFISILNIIAHGL